MDEDKNRANLAKHDVDFDDAMLVWSDFNRREEYDLEHSNALEDKWIVIRYVSI